MEYRLGKYIAVDVRDYEKAVAFYRDVLGWQLEAYTPVESKFTKGESIFFIASNESSPYNVYFEYEVDNFKEAKEALIAQGCTVQRDYSDKNGMFTDPYGMRFHLYEKGLDLPGIE